jgi:hypothetical protein
VYQCVEPTSAINFEAGNETTKSTEQVPVHGSKFGTFNHRILEARSLARSLGEMVNSGLPFVWVPGELPYFVQDRTSIHVKAKDQTWKADRVEENVPIFEEVVQVDNETSRACQHVAIAPYHALPAEGEISPDVPAKGNVAEVPIDPAGDGAD